MFLIQYSVNYLFYFKGIKKGSGGGRKGEKDVILSRQMREAGNTAFSQLDDKVSLYSRQPSTAITRPSFLYCRQPWTAITLPSCLYSRQSWTTITRPYCLYSRQPWTAITRPSWRLQLTPGMGRARKWLWLWLTGIPLWQAGFVSMQKVYYLTWMKLLVYCIYFVFI